MISIIILHLWYGMVMIWYSVIWFHKTKRVSKKKCIQASTFMHE